LILAAKVVTEQAAINSAIVNGRVYIGFLYVC
jgi:hypothetical protein